MAERYLALDLGAESGRAMVGSFDGERLSVAEVHRFQNRPVRLPTGLHWDIRALVRTALESLALRYRWVIEHIEEVTGRSISTIHVVGEDAVR